MDWVRRQIPRGGRVVCFSDVHGQPAALAAVFAGARLQDADLVVVHGDIVNRGPRSDVVWDQIEAARTERWVLGSGNHERYVRAHLDGPHPTGLMAEVHRNSAWTCAQLGPRARALKGLVDAVRIEAPELPPVDVVHASLISDDRGLSPQSSPAHLAAGTDGAAPWLVVGHVHRRYDFEARPGKVRVLNAGSVGSACDGDRRAGWLELEASRSGWQVEFHRVPYDLGRAEHDFQSSGFLTEAGPVARLIHAEWRQARPIVRTWFDQELGKVRSGEIELATSVDVFLRGVSD